MELKRTRQTNRIILSVKQTSPCVCVRLFSDHPVCMCIVPTVETVQERVSIVQMLQVWIKVKQQGPISSVLLFSCSNNGGRFQSRATALQRFVCHSPCPHAMQQLLSLTSCDVGGWSQWGSLQYMNGYASEPRPLTLCSGWRPVAKRDYALPRLNLSFDKERTPMAMWVSVKD